jgi:hypothetical protein
MSGSIAARWARIDRMAARCLSEYRAHFMQGIKRQGGDALAYPRFALSSRMRCRSGESRICVQPLEHRSRSVMVGWVAQQLMQVWYFPVEQTSMAPAGAQSKARLVAPSAVDLSMEHPPPREIAGLTFPRRVLCVPQPMCGSTKSCFRSPSVKK